MDKVSIENLEKLEEESKEPSESQVDRLTRQIREYPGLQLFHDELGEPFAGCPNENGYLQCYPIRSRAFRRFISNIFWKEKKRSYKKDVIDQIRANLEAIAVHDGTEHELHVRVGMHEGVIYYDLGDQAVAISNFVWKLVTDIPIRFRCYPGQLKQVTPERGGSIDHIFEFINVSGDDRKLLLITFIVCAFIPTIPHPVLVLYGPQGAAKTTLSRILLRLIDPTAAEDCPPHDLREFCQIVGHRWVVPLDNLSHISSPLSDLLCKLVTGASFPKRQLYSDDDDVIRRFRRVIMMNGVNLPVERADLLDRCLLLELERIPDDRRKTELLINEEIARSLPTLLGACFDILRKAMAIYPEISLSSKPRMADYAIWAAAISKAIGKTEHDFLKAYDDNVARQNLEALEASPLAVVLMSYLKGHNAISGTPEQVYQMLKDEAEEAGVEVKQLPKGGRGVSRTLQRIKPNLEREGYFIEKKGGTQRYLKISKSNVGNGQMMSSSNYDVVKQREMSSALKPALDKGFDVNDINDDISGGFRPRAHDEDFVEVEL